MRKEPLVNGSVYHIFTKSIAGYRIFRKKGDYKRFVEMLKFYRHESPPMKFSVYLTLSDKEHYYQNHLLTKGYLVEIIAYCMMPTHIHLVLKQLKSSGIVTFMKIMLDSYTRYFNLKNKRKGPLWQGRFKSVLIDRDEYLLHLTRYIHLNPVSDNLIEKPEDWSYSSYPEYLDISRQGICNFPDSIMLTPDEYKKFVENRKDYQRSLTRIKHLLLE